MRTTPGKAFATQVPGTPPPFDDSLAILSGYPADQWGQITISRGGDSGEHEVEILLRWSLSSVNSHGYEVDITNAGNLYLVRWNGALNSFNIMDGPVNTNVTANNGDVWYAQVVGSTVTVKCNGTTVLTRDVQAWAVANGGSYWSSGDPGMGAYTDNSLGAPSANNTFCIFAFSAGSL